MIRWALPLLAPIYLALAVSESSAKSCTPFSLRLRQEFPSGLRMKFCNQDKSLISLARSWIDGAHGQRPQSFSTQILFPYYVYDIKKGKNAWKTPDDANRAWLVAALQNQRWVGATFLLPDQQGRVRDTGFEQWNKGFPQLWKALSDHNQRWAQEGPHRHLFEPRMLRIPAMQASAIWLHGEIGDYFLLWHNDSIQLLGAEGMERALREFRSQSLLKDKNWPL